jgi:hypothetical protein
VRGGGAARSLEADAEAFESPLTRSTKLFSFLPRVFPPGIFQSPAKQNEKSSLLVHIKSNNEHN